MKAIRIALYGSRRQNSYLEIISRFLVYLHQRGIEVVAHPKLYGHLRDLRPGLAELMTCAPDGGFPADVYAVVSLGGDGTFLRTAHWVGDTQVPILGVNTGHLGYLTSVSISDLALVPEWLARDDARTEDLHVLQVDYEGAPHPFYALNEVSVTKDIHSSIINCAVALDRPDDHLAVYRADGVILSTAAGSSAYNLSLGGPVCAPTAPVMILTPIAAHSLSLRPLILGEGSRVFFTPAGRSETFCLQNDGETHILAMGTRVECRMAPFVVRRFVFAETTLARTLREKLNWGGES